MSRSKWKCPDCHSEDVVISLPVWFKETGDGLEQIQIDAEAAPLWWTCNTCGDSGFHEPDRVVES